MIVKVLYQSVLFSKEKPSVVIRQPWPKATFFEKKAKAKEKNACFFNEEGDFDHLGSHEIGDSCVIPTNRPSMAPSHSPTMSPTKAPTSTIPQDPLVKGGPS